MKANRNRKGGWIRPFFWSVWGVLLVACQAETLAPTRAIVVMPPPVVTSLSSTPLPATWTPAPLETADSQLNFAQLNPLAATALPSQTPHFSTYTPIPTFTPTATTTPTPNPFANYQANIPLLLPSGQLGPSKLGIHVIRHNDAGIMEFVRQAQPAVVKAVDDFGFLQEVVTASPGTVIIGRLSAESQDYVGNPEAAAQQFVQQQLEQYLLNPAVDYWEGWNEPDPNLENMAWYARFEQERVRLLAGYGLKAAIGGFATGVPELDEFELFLPAVATAQQYQGILTLHEYGAPDMTFLYGEPLPGYPAYPDRGALTFRYRWFYRELLEPRGLVIPLVISEAGIDGIIGNRPGPDGYGWEQFQVYWVEQGWGATGVEAFINQLAWYDAGVRQDGYVIGFAIFTAGPLGHFYNYDINPILPDLTNYVLSQR